MKRLLHLLGIFFFSTVFSRSYCIFMYAFCPSLFAMHTELSNCKERRNKMQLHISYITCESSHSTSAIWDKWSFFLLFFLAHFVLHWHWLQLVQQKRNHNDCRHTCIASSYALRLDLFRLLVDGCCHGFCFSSFAVTCALVAHFSLNKQLLAWIVRVFVHIWLRFVPTFNSNSIQQHQQKMCFILFDFFK